MKNSLAQILRCKQQRSSCETRFENVNSIFIFWTHYGFLAASVIIFGLVKREEEREKKKRAQIMYFQFRVGEKVRTVHRTRNNRNNRSGGNIPIYLTRNGGKIRY